MSDRILVLLPILKNKPINRTPEAQLAELVSLTKAINVEVVYAEFIFVRTIQPATYIGKGTLERFSDVISKNYVDVVVVGCPLSPIQQRNLERSWHVKVIDKTALILEIFGDRARTKEGELQVELAHLMYARSRLVRSWTHLERQRGGAGFLGGPGETQIELDRRLIDDDIAKIKKELEAVKRTRHLHRQARRKVPYPIVALVGYTNAGKSTLFNRLTKASVLAKDMLFATLDPTMRQIKLPHGQNVILSDTVGFISDLPTELVMAFRATLEEVLEADIILHVRDCAHPDCEAQKKDVEAVLKDIGALDSSDKKLIEVLNKIDLLPPDEYKCLLAQKKRQDSQWPISSLTGKGIDELLCCVESLLNKNFTEMKLKIPVTEGAVIASLYRKGQVLSRQDTEDIVLMHVLLMPKDLSVYQKYIALS